jgi:hypothetical protein
MTGTDVVVTVVRTGGFAGIRREWTAEPTRDQAPHWITLVKQCPWDDEDATAIPDAGADRFVWRIEARLGDDNRRAELPETHLHGAWRDLVCEVQSFESTPGR